MQIAPILLDFNSFSGDFCKTPKEYSTRYRVGVNRNDNGVVQQKLSIIHQFYSQLPVKSILVLSFVEELLTPHQFSLQDNPAN